MRYAKLITAMTVAAALGASACNRQQTADESVRQDPVAEERERQQAEAAELERQVADLEREWNEMQARVEKEAAGATAELKAEVKEDMTRVREAVADLRTTNAQNWWERHERVMEQNLEDVEADVRRFARRWNPAQPDNEVGTTGTATGWQAQRDRLVNRLEARVEAMEEALEDIDLKGAQETEVEDTRARVRKMKEDADRLRNASEEDWWEISKERVADYIERINRSIRRLDDDMA